MIQMAKEKILIFIPAYNCAHQVPRVLAQLSKLPRDMYFEALVLDNCSTDATLSRASQAVKSLDIPVTIGQNVANYGLGGSHKVAFKYAVADGFTHVIVLHGDDQGAIEDLIPHLIKGSFRHYDAFLGARFMPGSKLQGYSKFRTFGNIVYNLLFSLVTFRRLYDLGSGLNMFSVEALKRNNWLNFANDLTFNYYLILAMCEWKWDLTFFPISWREDDQISNVKLFKQARTTLGIVLGFLKDRGLFLARDHAGPVTGQYTFNAMASNDARHGQA
jgi:glycosyltransferase involved in cell wall biosynthesis